MTAPKKIIFTGGGSGGHVMPALTLIEKIKKETTLEVFYIGGIKGIERELVTAQGLTYFPVSTGKLRRYFSLENFLDVGRLIKGIFQSFFLLRGLGKKNELLIFSTGGFVTVPVAIAGWLRGIPIYLHEQTSRAGLANRMVGYFAKKIFLSFESSKQFFPTHKTELSGYPLREEFYLPYKSFKMEGVSFDDVEHPILFVTGGGNGSKLLNDKILENLDVLTQKYFVVHQVGKVFLEEFKKYKSSHYLPLAFIGPEMPELMKKADVIISRAGAGTVAELLCLKKRSLFIPLAIAQKNEQYYNALEAKEKLGSLVLTEAEFKTTDLLALCDSLREEKFFEALKEKEVRPSDFLLNQLIDQGL